MAGTRVIAEEAGEEAEDVVMEGVEVEMEDVGGAEEEVGLGIEEVQITQDARREENSVRARVLRMENAK